MGEFALKFPNPPEEKRPTPNFGETKTLIKLITNLESVEEDDNQQCKSALI